MKPIHYTTLFKLPDAGPESPVTKASFADLCALEQAQIPYPANDLAEYGAEAVSIGALVRCPHCGKNFHGGKYGDAHKLLQNARFGELVNKVYSAQRKSEMPDENTFLFETLVGELRRKAFFENRREERPGSGRAK